MILIKFALFKFLFKLPKIFHLLLDAMAGFLQSREVLNFIFLDDLLAEVAHALQLFDFFLHVCFVLFLHLNRIRFLQVHLKLFK